MNRDWTIWEVELTIISYLKMLSIELVGQSYSKSDFRRSLMLLLDGRTEGAIERKYQNISAVLINFGLPYIRGYKPLFHYQQLIEEQVADYLLRNPALESNFDAFANTLLPRESTKSIEDFHTLIVEPPKTEFLKESLSVYGKSPLKVNYLEVEQNNTILGLEGERFALEFEKWNLMKNGKSNLAKKIRWISQEEGDGAGFDILSKNLDGTDKYIEVKTTKLGKFTPFYFSRNELIFSKTNSVDFHLYRVFDFQEKPKVFTKQGSLDEICQTIPVTYKGYF